MTPLVVFQKLANLLILKEVNFKIILKKRKQEMWWTSKFELLLSFCKNQNINNISNFQKEITHKIMSHLWTIPLICVPDIEAISELDTRLIGKQIITQTITYSKKNIGIL